MSGSLTEELPDFTLSVDHEFISAQLVESHGAAGM